jgi:hypothetical protein
MRILVVLAIGLSTTSCDWDGPRERAPSTTLPAGPTPLPNPGTPDPATRFNRPDIGEPAAITVGEHIDAAVQPSDPNCYPIWDASAVCRQYALVATMDGKLTATLTRRGGGEMDLFVLHPDGGPARWDPSLKITTDVKSGETIGIVVMAYSPPQHFTLDTTIQP